MSYRGLPGVSLILCLAACAGPQPTTTSNVATAPVPAPDCERTYRVGSNIPVMNCAPKPTEAERQRTIDEWEKAALPKHGQIGSGG
jgi:hypothetical protein